MNIFTYLFIELPCLHCHPELSWLRVRGSKTYKQGLPSPNHMSRPHARVWYMGARWLCHNSAVPRLLVSICHVHGLGNVYVPHKDRDVCMYIHMHTCTFIYIICIYMCTYIIYVYGTGRKHFKAKRVIHRYVWYRAALPLRAHLPRPFCRGALLSSRVRSPLSLDAGLVGPGEGPHTTESY